MKLVTWNIQWGKGRDGRIDLERIARTLEGADIIALQEVERHWREQDFPDQATRLGELFAGFDHVFGPAVDVGGRAIGEPRRQIGNMILSRFPIATSRNLPLPSRPVSGHANDQQAMLEAVIPDAGMRVYNLHLNYLSAAERQRQLRQALDFIAEADLGGGPVMLLDMEGPGPDDEWIAPLGTPPTIPRASVLIGDFNMTPASPDYAAMIATDRFADVLAGSDGVTFPGEGGLRLDYCFVSADLAPAVTRAWIDPDADGSDHQPVWVALHQLI